MAKSLDANHNYAKAEGRVFDQKVSPARRGGETQPERSTALC